MQNTEHEVPVFVLGVVTLLFVVAFGCLSLAVIRGVTATWEKQQDPDSDYRIVLEFAVLIPRNGKLEFEDEFRDAVLRDRRVRRAEDVRIKFVYPEAVGVITESSERGSVMDFSGDLFVGIEITTVEMHRKSVTEDVEEEISRISRGLYEKYRETENPSDKLAPWQELLQDPDPAPRYAREFIDSAR